MIKQRKPNPNRLTLTIPEASKFLGIGLNQAYAAAEKGNIPTVRIGDRVLVLRKALMKMLGEDARDAAADRHHLSRPGAFRRHRPADQCCGGCRHWAGTATRKQAPCGKYMELTSCTGRQVPRSAPACKYFLVSESA